MSEVDNTIQARLFMLKSAIFSLADKKSDQLHGFRYIAKEGLCYCSYRNAH